MEKPPLYSTPACFLASGSCSSTLSKLHPKCSSLSLSEGLYFLKLQRCWTCFWKAHVLLCRPKETEHYFHFNTKRNVPFWRSDNSKWTQLPAGFHPVYFPLTLQEQQHPGADSRSWGWKHGSVPWQKVSGRRSPSSTCCSRQSFCAREWEGALGAAGADISGTVMLLHMNE